MPWYSVGSVFRSGHLERVHVIHKMAGNDTAIFQFTLGETQFSGFHEVHHQMRMQVIAGSHKTTPQQLQKRTVVAQISLGGEHKPICKQEERSKEQLRSRKKGRKWRFNGFVRAESENWKRLSYWQWWEVRVVEQVKRGWQKPEVCSCREQQTNDKKGQKDKEWDKGWWWGR